MSYGICRVEKVHGGAVGAMQYHNDRELGYHSNRDIDGARTRDNYELVPHGEYEDEIQRRIDDGYTGTRKIRKDAVRLVEGVVTASPEWFDENDAERQAEFFAAAKDFAAGYFGESNLVHFTVHMDETTPHAHFGAVPLKSGKLSWKEFFDGREAMSRFQDAFFAQVSSRFGMERGEVRSEGEPSKVHVPTRDLKAQARKLEREVAEQEKRLDELRREAEAERVRREAEAERLERRVTKAREQEVIALERVRAAEQERDEAEDRLEWVRRREQEAVGRNEKLRAIVAAIREYPAAGRGQKLEIIDRVARLCDELREQVEEATARVRRAAFRVGERIDERLRPRFRPETREAAQAAMKWRENPLEAAREASAAMRRAGTAQQQTWRSRAR